MKQSETGTRNDLIEHRFRIAKEDLETAYLLLEAEQLLHLAKEYYNKKNKSRD